MALLNILFLVFFSLLVPKSRSDPTYLTSYCPITTVFAPNSKYEANLNKLFHSLSSNATTSGFFSSAVNQVVFGLFLCRGDLNTTACTDCVSAATTNDLPKNYCRNRKQAVIWYDECMVRYSNHPLSGMMENNPSFYMRNNMNTTAAETGFSDLLQNTLNDTVTRAASEGPTMKFATSEVNIKTEPNKSLYALAQCTPDLNTSACTQCLNDAIELLPLSDGARILSPSCNIRYETYKFFNLSGPLSPAQAPAQAGTDRPPVDSALSPQTRTANNPVPTSPPGTSASQKRTQSSYFNLFGGVFVVLSVYYCYIVV